MEELDGVLHQPQRLRIMALLYRNRQLSFTALRDALTLSDGNLASHAAKLIEAGYLEAGRALITEPSTRFELRYRITPAGSSAFKAYAAALRAIIAVEADGAKTPAIPD